VLAAKGRRSVAIAQRRHSFSAAAPRKSKIFSAPAVKKGTHVRQSTANGSPETCAVRGRRNRMINFRRSEGQGGRTCHFDGMPAPDPIGAQEGLSMSGRSQIFRAIFMTSVQPCCAKRISRMRDSACVPGSGPRRRRCDKRCPRCTSLLAKNTTSARVARQSPVSAATTIGTWAAMRSLPPHPPLGRACSSSDLNRSLNSGRGTFRVAQRIFPFGRGNAPVYPPLAARRVVMPGPPTTRA
jgi:hypothetical protein